MTTPFTLDNLLNLPALELVLPGPTAQPVEPARNESFTDHLQRAQTPPPETSAAREDSSRPSTSPADDRLARPEDSEASEAKEQPVGRPDDATENNASRTDEAESDADHQAHSEESETVEAPSQAKEDETVEGGDVQEGPIKIDVDSDELVDNLDVALPVDPGVVLPENSGDELPEDVDVEAPSTPTVELLDDSLAEVIDAAANEENVEEPGSQKVSVESGDKLLKVVQRPVAELPEEAAAVEELLPANEPAVESDPAVQPVGEGTEVKEVAEEVLMVEPHAEASDEDVRREPADVDEPRVNRPDGPAQQHSEEMGHRQEAVPEVLPGDTPQRSERERERKPVTSRRGVTEPPDQSTRPAASGNTAPTAAVAVEPVSEQWTAPVAASAAEPAANTPGVAAEAVSGNTNDGQTSVPVRIAGDQTPRTRAAGQAGKAPEPGQVDPMRFVDRVARAFRTMGDRSGSVRLRLSPPELGSLRLEISVRNGMMTARVEAETHTARNLLLDNLPALRDRLAQQEIKIQQFDVDLMDRSPGGLPDRTADHNASHDRRGTNRASQTTGEGDAETETRPGRAGVSRPGEGTRLNVIV